MTEGEACRVYVERDWFLQQMIAHHRRGDHYPDPRIIGDELHLTPMQLDGVLRNLRALGWIAASPYDPERLRLTPCCWDVLRRVPMPWIGAESHEQRILA
jgi:hypothetical protein